MNTICKFSIIQEEALNNPSRVGIIKTKSIRKNFQVYQGKRTATGQKCFAFANHFIKNAKS